MEKVLHRAMGSSILPLSLRYMLTLRSLEKALPTKLSNGRGEEIEAVFTANTNCNTHQSIGCEGNWALQAPIQQEGVSEQHSYPWLKRTSCSWDFFPKGGMKGKIP